MALKESSYLDQLRISSPEAADRYLDKIKQLNCDPYALSEVDFDYGLTYVPPIASMDILTYIVFTHSFYTHEQMRAYKSLAAYKYFKSGFVEKVGFKVINDLVLLIGKVQHSMRARETKLRVWIIAETGGSICTAHCICMAGLGEVCSHVTAVLYAAEHAAYLKQQKNEKNVACTDVKSTWPVPTQSGTHPIEAASLDWGKVIEEKNYKEIPPMDDSEMLDLLQELQNSNCDAVLMRHVEPFASQLSDENNEKVSIPVLFNVYHKKYEKMPLDDLIQLGMKCKMEVTQNIRREIEDKTQDQRKCAEWYRQRTGRVTASIFKDVCRTNVEKPSLSLIKSICYPRKISTRAIRWGINHEQLAIDAYKKETSRNHRDFIVNTIGLVVCMKWPQLGASPDGFVYCDCCAAGTLEVKCPFSLRENGNLQEYASRKDSCLECDKTGTVKMNKKHKYYYQVQAQIFICKLNYCDFVVWCPNFIFIERVLPDIKFWEEIKDKVLNFHAKVIMPELLGRYYTSRVPGGNITKWCFCNNVDDGQPMVQCSYENCNIFWFHIGCVNLLEKPKTRWTCSICNQKLFHDYAT
ncbi:uncharacterized protein LOC126884063 [Diabrotica virgifera virgifera]|uniref:PHD-type domain-containing protein n=1 Tax=Diabrotica virgifera virgifera TaxID=50390 RepID=A0ABM5K6I9_DIAVI|nr:uncharacterized protein LOC126884063 [Diabrotica virgifera virgifera]